MPKILGMHEIELLPEVKAEDFERFFVEVVASRPFYPGWRRRLLKGDKGERAGTYVLLYEIESIEARDEFYPPSGQLSPVAREFLEGYHDAFEWEDQQWARFVVGGGGPSRFTDYIVVC